MKRVLRILGYAWAAAALPVVLMAFMGMNFWAGALARSTGVVISPWYTGGEVARTIDRGEYRTRIHRPVFDALIGQRDEGFVQVDFVAPAGVDTVGAGAVDSLEAGVPDPAASEAAPAARAALPPTITEEVDFDADGQADFHLAVTTGTGAVTVNPLSPRVLGLRESFRLDDGVGVRVELKNVK